MSCRLEEKTKTLTQYCAEDNVLLLVTTRCDLLLFWRCGSVSDSWFLQMKHTHKKNNKASEKMPRSQNLTVINLECKVCF